MKTRSRSNDDGSGGKVGVGAVNRALQVLSAFESSENGLTLSMISEETGLYESTILRLLESLIAARYAKRLPNGRYVVGPKVLILSEMYRRSFKLSDYVLPHLRALVETSGESAGLYVREGDARVCLHQIQPRRSVRMHVVEGKAFPLDIGAAGHVIRAFEDQAEGERFQHIRESGYCVTKAERDPESAAIACPVFQSEQHLLGAVSLVIPLYRCTDELFNQLIPAVQETAKRLSEDLGGVWEI
ncbi:IclR family transcriptional regulator [Orrella marina]|uniref:IclR family transcriptional regulator n=1 Tax=Orrella marina TaxID=2163011 RepID=UPI00131ED20C|nr:IclR family transcriptional regulator [Orrella marina]